MPLINSFLITTTLIPGPRNTELLTDRDAHHRLAGNGAMDPQAVAISITEVFPGRVALKMLARILPCAAAGSTVRAKRFPLAFTSFKPGLRIGIGRHE
jgi:hypothetical protein